MTKKNCLSKNLRAYQNARGSSLAEFSAELGVPKSTVQSIMSEGNTTLDTALRLAEGLGVSLDELVYDEKLPERLGLAKWLLDGLGWFTVLSEEKQAAVARHLDELLGAVGK